MKRLILLMMLLAAGQASMASGPGRVVIAKAEQPKVTFWTGTFWDEYDARYYLFTADYQIEEEELAVLLEAGEEGDAHLKLISVSFDRWSGLDVGDWFWEQE
jgi:hypothetical protein